jgi:hypothetical protein
MICPVFLVLLFRMRGKDFRDVPKLVKFTPIAHCTETRIGHFVGYN